MNSDKETVFRRLDRSLNFLSLVGVSVIWLLSAVLIIPFGASTVAMYDAVLHSIRKGEGRFFPTFLRTFRLSFRRAAPVGIGYLLLGAALIFCIRFANVLSADSRGWMLLSYVYTGLLLLLGVVGFFLFPTFLHCEGSAKQCVKLGLLLSFRHLFTSITCFLMLYLAGWAALRFPACLLLLPGVCCLVSTMVLEPYYAKEQDSQQDALHEER